MIITGCGQHDSVNESAQAISLRQQLCVNVSLQTELKDGLGCLLSLFLKLPHSQEAKAFFLMVVVVLGGNWGGLFPVWPICLYKYNDCRNSDRKRQHSRASP